MKEAEAKRQEEGARRQTLEMLLQQKQQLPRQDVMVGGVVGMKAEILNGVYQVTGDLYNGKPLYSKRNDHDKWLLFLTTNTWCFTSTASKDSKEGKGWCFSVESGKDHPTQVGKWKIYANGAQDKVEEHAPMKCIVCTPSLSRKQQLRERERERERERDRERDAAQAGQGGTVSVKWAKTTGPDGAPNTTNNSNGLYMAITAMPAYQNYSFDELRVQDYGAGRTKGVLQQVACSGGLPRVGMTVTTISTQQGAPRGKSTLHFSTGQQITIKELHQEDGKWYAAGHTYSTLWFPLSSTDAYSGGVGGLGQPAATVEALFDRNRCGSKATLDVQRTRVEFSGKATVLLSSPVPPEGVHVMQFEVHGGDQCLVGIASPDCYVETHLGNSRGGYGFFAASGKLLIDGNWMGDNGLCKFQRGDRVAVHVDMSRRTLQFSISRSAAG